MSVSFDPIACQVFIKDAIELVNRSTKEEVLVQHLTSCLPKIFPNQPWWVKHHFQGAEHHVLFLKNGKSTYGFVDSLVGLTAIEYEKNLSSSALFKHGLDQVKDYCAGLLNQGHAKDLVIGILSDTVNWYAYKISELSTLGKDEATLYGREHINLEEVDLLELNVADERSAVQLKEFLIRHIGREGARPLNAETLARDLGFYSNFCDNHIKAIYQLTESAFNENPKYSGLIMKLWQDFVAYLGEEGIAGQFDKDVYVRELYLLTLAKLLCANVIEKKALVSNEINILAILNGDYFKIKGLSNFVEFDYFGWINSDPHISQLIPIAQAIQDDLRAYDFNSPTAEDLFGNIFAQLAERSQRLLLGQEWTPAWLAKYMVEQALKDIPINEDPRFIDMCCGSGAMIVETVKQAKNRLDNLGIEVNTSYISRLSNSITGFDIDPLAVMLAKVGWIVAARDKLEPFGQFNNITIPIYHADSLFVATPLSKNIEEGLFNECYELVLDDCVVLLPSFLISPDYRSLFDHLITYAYDLAMAQVFSEKVVVKGELKPLIEAAINNAGVGLNDQHVQSTLDFFYTLILALDVLNRDGRNGIWAFILRNSYRPGLVEGLFNGLVSNPPWLALSKIADNPYKSVLREKAEKYKIKPEGPSHLHIELATVFLLHAVDKYLQDNAVVSCVLPETILSGHHHNPFRLGEFRSGRNSVPLTLEALWRVKKGTFKNEAVVLLGTKKSSEVFSSISIPGKEVSPQGMLPITFNTIIQGKRTAWSDKQLTSSKNSGFFEPADFRQGADIMPRTLIFHQTDKAPNGYWSLSKINRKTSEQRYLVTAAKKHKEFHLPDCLIPERFIFDTFLSNHLTPFDISSPAKALLPINRANDGGWEPISFSSLAIVPSSRIAFDRIFTAVGPGTSIKDFYDLIDTNRHKLTTQIIPKDGWLIFMGAGGDLVCAAHVDASQINDNSIIDQTLYWASVPDEDEAIYLVGLLNSEAINDVIKEFQPRGQFGARHIHKLPLGVTPKFNPLDTAHIEVLCWTRKLIAEWEIEKTNEDVKSLLNPNITLASRRRKIREQIKKLHSYSEYNIACRNLYAV